MPFDLKIDAAQGIVHSRVWGEFTCDDVTNHRELLDADPEFDPGFRQLVDFTEVTRFGLSAASIQSFAGSDPWDADARRAFIATTDFIFGMTRMYEMLMAPTASNIAVFRRTEEAKKWLDID